jgi:hexosaminidase
MEARYHRLINAEQLEAAEQYLLSDFADKSQYSSVQHYSDNTLNPCLPSTYTFVDKVLTDLVAQHKAAGVPLNRYHLGADETAGAWHGSPACEEFISSNPDIENVEQLGSYFISRVAQLVQDKGIIAGGWSDGMREFQPDVKSPMQVNVWDPLMWQGHLAAEKFAAQGWHTILSYPDVLYFDFPYAIDPNEPGYYWATRATDSYKLFQFMPDSAELNARLWTNRLGNAYKAELSKIRSNTQSKTEPKVEYEGIQAHLWSEIVRHDSVAQYMYYPRLISYAQKAWSKSPWESTARDLTKHQLESAINQDWAIFSELLVNKHLPKLVQQGIQFRLPPPGAIIENGSLKMNHLFNGVQLEYQDKFAQWQTYSSPIKVELPLKIRAKLSSDNISYNPRYSAEIGVK